ncbi:hypothetical protein NSQ59_13995 [Margalitia sp. FSL K6-0131]|uniref:hypothetical protein n=1 Tax=Margalitia sp. FSL K6-0131 TaxID=2954604 RepID=UPI0030F53D16
MDLELEQKILLKRREIAEQIHTNIDFIINCFGYVKKQEFFEMLSNNCNVSKRKIRGWYTDMKLPNLSNTDITKICSYLKIHFSDLISHPIDRSGIKNYEIPPFVPAELAKKNILNMLINRDIGNSQKFESFFEGNYTSNYFYVLQRKNKHQRNISWSFIITSAIYFEMSIGEFFINEDVDTND